MSRTRHPRAAVAQGPGPGTTSETAESSAEARKTFYRGTEAEQASTAGGQPSGVQLHAATAKASTETSSEMAAETLIPADLVAEVKRIIDRCFPKMKDAERREIISYVANWSLDAIPDFLKRAA